MNAYRPSDFRTPRTLDTSKFGPYATLDVERPRPMGRLRKVVAIAFGFKLVSATAIILAGATLAMIGGCQELVGPTAPFEMNGETLGLMVAAVIIIGVVMHDVWKDRR